MVNILYHHRREGPIQFPFNIFIIGNLFLSMIVKVKCKLTHEIVDLITIKDKDDEWEKTSCKFI